MMPLFGVLISASNSSSSPVGAAAFSFFFFESTSASIWGDSKACAASRRSKWRATSATGPNMTIGRTKPEREITMTDVKPWICVRDGQLLCHPDKSDVECKTRSTRLSFFTWMFESDPFVGGSLAGSRIDGCEDDVIPMILGERLGPFAPATKPRSSSTHGRSARRDARWRIGGSNGGRLRWKVGVEDEVSWNIFGHFDWYVLKS